LPIALWRGVRHETAAEPRSAVRLLAGWTLLALVPLSLSRGKLDYYLLPLYPAVSLIVARYLAATPWRRADVLWSRAVLGLAGLGFVLAAVLPRPSPDEWLPGAGPRLLLAGAGAVLAIAAALAALHPSPARLAAVLGIGVGALTTVLAGFFVPAFREAQPNR